jgi:hypothetical protein
MLEQYGFQRCRQRCASIYQHRRQPQDNAETIDRPDICLNGLCLDSEAISRASDVDAFKDGRPTPTHNRRDFGYVPCQYQSSY